MAATAETAEGCEEGRERGERPLACSAYGGRHLLEQVERVLHTRLHSRLDDHVANLPGGRLDEDGQHRALTGLAEGRGVYRPVVSPAGRHARVDLRRDDALVRHDLAKLPVERPLDAPVGVPNDGTINT